MLRIDSVSLSFGDTVALSDVSFDVDRGEVVAVVGASGSGKTSLLRCIAGLENPDSGRITLDEADLLSVPVHRRQVGMMFQDYALFPHLDVAGNVAFGLDVAGADDVDGRVGEMLAWVGLEGFEAREVATLSGGEQQRVALARTVAPRPRLVLLDEPLGALDAPMRDRLLPELASLLADVDVPALYVTHDLSEAFAIADRIAILGNGRLLQIDSPEQLWRAPGSAAVARFLGYHSIVEVTVSGNVAATPWGAVTTALPAGAHTVAVRPDAVIHDPIGELVVDVVEVGFDAGIYIVEGTALSHPLRFSTRQAIEPGSSVRVAIAVDGLVPVERL